MAVTQQRSGPLRGSDGQVFDLAEAAVTKRKSRIPEIALGVLLVAGCALAALAWQTIADPSRTVLAAGSDIARGQLITSSDLHSIELASNDLLNVLDVTESDLVVGRIAQVDLAVGTVIAPEMVADIATIEPGQALVGVAVDRSSVPTTTLRVGSLLDVVATPGNTGEDALADTSDSVLVRNAVVAELIIGEEETYLSLAVGEADAVTVARAASADRIRLLAVPDDRPLPAPPAPDETTTDDPTAGDRTEDEDSKEAADEEDQ